MFIQNDIAQVLGSHSKHPCTHIDCYIIDYMYLQIRNSIATHMYMYVHMYMTELLSTVIIL